MTDAINSHSRRMYNAQKNTRADLATPLDDPRVLALVALVKRAQDIIDPCYPAKHGFWQNAASAALSALEENK